MPFSTAPPETLQNLQQETGVNLRRVCRRVCLFGLKPAAVRALGQLLGRHFYILVTKNELELFSAIRSAEGADGLVLDAGRLGPNPAELIQKIRSLGPLNSGETALPIFILARPDDASPYGEMESLGVQGFFEKPGDVLRLAAALRKELDLKEEATEIVVSRANSETVVIGAMKYVEENLASIRNSTDVSDHIGVTREHLSRQFTRYAGQTLWDFVTTCRVRRARELLREKDLLVKEVARQVGFYCESSFFRAFIRKTGHTPEDFRKTRRD